MPTCFHAIVQADITSPFQVCFTQHTSSIDIGASGESSPYPRPALQCTLDTCSYARIARSAAHACIVRLAALLPCQTRGERAVPCAVPKCITLKSLHCLHPVLEQLLNEVHMRHEHAAAAVALELQHIQRLNFCVISGHKTDVCFPLVSHHLHTQRRRL